MTTTSTGADLLRTVRTRLRGGIFAVGLFSLVINLLMLTAPLYMMQVYDRVLVSSSGHTLVLLTALALGLMFAGGLLDLVRTRLLLRLSMRLDRCLSGRLFDLVVTRGARSVENSNLQPLNDLDTLRGFLSGNTLSSLFDAPWAPLFVAVIMLMHPLLGLVALGGAVILFLLAVGGELATRRQVRESSRQSSAAQGFCEGALRNAEVIEAMGMLPALRRRWQVRHSAGLAAQARGGDRGNLFLAAAKVVRPGLQVLMLGSGAYLSIEQVITPGVMIAATIIMGRALAPVEGVIAQWRSVVLARAAHTRLCEILRRTPAETERLSLPRPEGRVEVESVVAAPPGSGKAVIKGLSFALPAGESLGIIGPSAAGKSTLARLLVGVWSPASGSIRLDGAEIGQWHPAERGAHLGYLPQDVELFDGTVAENITRFWDLESNSIVTAARIAGAHEMILALADGYETQIGVGGATLSGGQRQRIGLARALYGKPALMVLDEPNAHLDGDGEAALQRALEAMKAHGTTVVIIAHRPSVLRSVDKLLILRDGRAEMFGPRDEVLAKLTRAVQAPADRLAQLPVTPKGKPPARTPKRMLKEAS